MFHPVILLPDGIDAHLTPLQLESVLLHEMAHVRRRDNVTGVIHRVVEILFWFHPLIWWMGARLHDERERACDEDVLCARGSSRRRTPKAFSEFANCIWNHHGRSRAASPHRI